MTVVIESPSGPQTMPVGKWTTVVMKDETAPSDQYRDDLGTILAFLLPIADDPGTLPAVQSAWKKVIDDLVAERDRSVGSHSSDTGPA
jgi:hypothetical protein